MISTARTPPRMLTNLEAATRIGSDEQHPGIALDVWCWGCMLLWMCLGRDPLAPDGEGKDSDSSTGDAQQPAGSASPPSSYISLPPSAIRAASANGAAMEEVRQRVASGALQLFPQEA